MHNSLVVDSLLKLFLWVKCAASVLLQPCQVEQGQPIHHDLSDDAASREDVHLIGESGIPVKLVGRGAPSLWRHIAPNVVVQVAEEFIVRVQIIVFNQHGLVGMDVCHEQPVVRRDKAVFRLYVAML